MVKDVWFHKHVLGCWDQYETIQIIANGDAYDMVSFFLTLPHDFSIKLSVTLHPPEGDNLDATNSSTANNVDGQSLVCYVFRHV